MGLKAGIEQINFFLNHKLSKSHLDSTIALSDFLNSKLIDQSIIVLNKKPEEERLKHRQNYVAFNGYFYMFAKGGMSFRGHDERHESCQQRTNYPKFFK